MNAIEKGVLWLLVIGLYAVTVIAVVTSAPVALLGVLITVVFVFVHGSKFYGIKNILVLTILTFVISWCLESLSIATGFPFGNYHYAIIPGGMIGEVPWVIMPGYLAMGYLAWIIGHILLDHFDSTIRKRDILLLPFIGAFVMVMWDLVMDPIHSTVRMEWIWEDGGFYFGVPLTNFFGWYFTIFLIYLTFSLYISRYNNISQSSQKTDKTFWSVAPLMYLGTSLQFLLAPFFITANLIIYWSMFLIAIYTMVFVAIVALLRVNGKLAK